VLSRHLLLERMRAHRYAVQSSTAAGGHPQSAVVGVAVSDRFEIVFDTVASSRKHINLRRDPRIAFVLGSVLPDAAWTIQFEGLADEPRDAERDRLVELYLTVFPDGVDRQQWPGLTYFRARPVWIRSSDWTTEPAEIVEFDEQALERL
jgi:Pyridoxamine 5'-phosphate oxidase